MSGVPEAQVPLDRVVAVVGDLGDGRQKWGTGFLLSARLVLTAWHCTVGDLTSREPIPLTVHRRCGLEWQSAPATRLAQSHKASGHGYEWGLDVAVLRVEVPPWGNPAWSFPAFARVDRSQSGELGGCVAVGYPMYMLDAGMQRDTAEVQGSIRQGDGAISGYLVLQDDRHDRRIRIPDYVTADQTVRGSAWGGLSGAAVFY